MGFIDRLKQKKSLIWNKLLKAISIYSSGGVPILNQLDSSDDVDRKAIDGGFLVAITQFSSMKMPGDDLSFITFESKGSGTFIVGKTEHFIGSLLWNANLDVQANESKEALADLLRYLELSCDSKDLDSVQMHVQQFTLNTQ